MSTSNNIAFLTRSHNAIAAKKNAKKQQVKEVLFDDDARREFLTGFHKRKVAKADAARTKAKEREKQERLETRREQRRMLREQAAENAAQVEAAYGAVLGDRDEEEDEWNGIGTSNQTPAERDDQYEDEQVLATVTVVEDFDPDTIIHGPAKPDINPSSSTPSAISKPKPLATKKAVLKKHRTKEKKVRYQTKDARRREQTKQHARRTEKAELAGGKASRKSKTAGGKKKHGSKR